VTGLTPSLLYISLEIAVRTRGRPARVEKPLRCALLISFHALMEDTMRVSHRLLLVRECAPKVSFQKTRVRVILSATYRASDECMYIAQTI